jgi:hypothetical protein
MITTDESLAFSIIGSYLTVYGLLDSDTYSTNSFKSHMLEKSKQVKDRALRSSIENIILAENIKIAPNGILYTSLDSEYFNP